MGGLPPNNDLREPLLPPPPPQEALANGDGEGHDSTFAAETLSCQNGAHVHDSDLNEIEEACEPRSPCPDDPNDNENSSTIRIDTENHQDYLQNPWRNHNVVLSFLLCAVSGVADSIWSSVVLSGFLLALAGAMGKSSRGNTLVGTAEAVQGLTQLIIALPVGLLADKWSKAKTMQLGGVLMLLTIGLTLWALYDINRWAGESMAEANKCYIILVVALGLWGIIDGISYGPSQALFSDSIPRGKRSEMLTWLYSCYLLSSAVGPIVSITLILTVSANAKDWSLREIFPVFFFGVCLEIPAALFMFFFSDKYVVPESLSTEEEGVDVVAEAASTLDVNGACENGGAVATIPNAATTSPMSNDTLDENGAGQHNVVDDDNNIETPLLNDETGPLDAANVDGANDATRTRQTAEWRKRYQGVIPYVLFLSSLISSLGSGASVKYFPLFFKQVGFGSAQVQGIFLLVPIFISAFSHVAQVAGKRMGRVEATFVSILLGVALLFCMTWLSHGVEGGSGGDHDPLLPDDAPVSSLWNDNPHRALLVVAVYLFRTGIINCSYPLLESILMDNVPSNQRARWKSLESIASFGWTGSAFVGGILSDTHSYQFTFAMTAWMQLASGVLLLLIQPLVEEEGS